jgi:hypothetical protein
MTTNPNGRDADAIVRLPPALAPVKLTLTDLGEISSLKQVDVGAGLVFVADVGSASLRAFAKSASGDSAPAFVVSNFGAAGRSVWDLHYEATSDRLYATASDGVVLVYDAFSSAHGASGPDRTITPTAGGTQAVSTLRGIDVASDHTLVACDNGNGYTQILTIANADTANGDTPVLSQLLTNRSDLPSTADVAISGANILLAYALGGRLQRYALPSGGLPFQEMALAGAASIAASSQGRVHVLSNPPGRDSDALVTVDATQMQQLATFGNVDDIQSIEALLSQPMATATSASTPVALPEACS